MKCSAEKEGKRTCWTSLLLSIGKHPHAGVYRIMHWYPKKMVKPGRSHPGGIEPYLMKERLKKKLGLVDALNQTINDTINATIPGIRTK